MTIDEVNAMTPDEFIARIGWVFEDSPWVAERAASLRPFSSFHHLRESLNAQILSASREDQLALLRAHPDLGTRARVSASSAREQSGAGLTNLSQEEYDRLLELNNEWKQKFGFPFLFAVKGSGRQAIMETMKRRLQSSEEEELNEALAQVFRIAGFRLEEILT